MRITYLSQRRIYSRSKLNNNMNQNVRAVLFLIIIQTGFITIQYLSSFGGLLNYLGLYLIMPLLVTELHYRYLQGAHLQPGSINSHSLRIGAFWVLAISGSTIVSYFLLSQGSLQSVLVPDGLLVALMKQASIVVMGVFVSGLMYKDVQRVMIEHHTEELAV